MKIRKIIVRSLLTNSTVGFKGLASELNRKLHKLSPRFMDSFRISRSWVTNNIDAAKTKMNSSTHAPLHFLNRVTGFHSVEERKNEVILKDEILQEAKLNANQTKKSYDLHVEDRLKCQKDLNALMQRKDSWNEGDITSFTELYRKDLSFELHEEELKSRYKNAARLFDGAQEDYLAAMRERYVEEQMFSEKVRSASNMWTWGLILTHLILFTTVNFFVEPRKKRQLKQDVGEMILASADTNYLRIAAILEHLSADATPKPIILGKAELGAHSVADANILESNEKHVPELKYWYDTWYDLHYLTTFIRGAITGSLFSIVWAIIML